MWTQEDINKKIKQGTLPSQDLFPETLPKKEELSTKNTTQIKLDQLLLTGDCIFIPGNTPSLKNSKEIQQMYTGKSDCCKAPYTKIGYKKYKCTKCNNDCQLGRRPLLVPSSGVLKYKKATEGYWVKNKNNWQRLMKDRRYPIALGMYFVRDSLRKWDYVNINQIIQDLMVDYNWLPDDNYQYVVPVFLGHHKDTKDPGTYIVILKEEYKRELKNYI